MDEVRIDVRSCHNANHITHCTTSSHCLYHIISRQPCLCLRLLFLITGDRQNHYNLVYREEEREMIPQCIDQNVAVIPWSPLARGFLAGTRHAEDIHKQDMDENKQLSPDCRAKTDAFAHGMYYAPADFEIVAAVEEVAKRYAVKPAQIALAWILNKPGVSAPIIGATKMYQLDEAIAACSMQLKPEDVRQLEEKYIPHRVLGFTP